MNYPLSCLMCGEYSNGHVFCPDCDELRDKAKQQAVNDLDLKLNKTPVSSIDQFRSDVVCALCCGFFAGIAMTLLVTTLLTRR